MELEMPVRVTVMLMVLQMIKMLVLATSRSESQTSIISGPYHYPTTKLPDLNSMLSGK